MAVSLRKYQVELINRIRNELINGRRRVCAVLGCGGGKSIIQGAIAEKCASNKHRVLFLVHRKELLQQIRHSFELCGVDFDYCTVGMVQTATRRTADIKSPTIILVDEAHHILSASYTRIINCFPDAIVLGFTATPCRMAEGGLGAVFESIVEGPSTRWLINNGYLADYRYYGVTLADASNLRTARGDYIKADVARLMEQAQIFGDTIKEWLRRANGKKTIIYCASVASSKQTTKAFVDAGITAAHIDGGTPKETRDRLVSQFKAGKITVLCNVDLFGEGFDVPDCECVVLLRPTQSLSLHIQQSMRSMRVNPDNPDKVALIIDHVGNYTRHGLPDDERTWTLTAKKRKEKQSEIHIKQCPICYAVMGSEDAQCPACGYVFPSSPRAELKRMEEAEIAEITAKPYSEYSECSTWRELEMFRKTHTKQDGSKYRFTWSLHKAVELGIKIPEKYCYSARFSLSREEYRRATWEK